jgi:Zn finger protein HypA/HybF involved in hydrogenase expression
MIIYSYDKTIYVRAHDKVIVSCLLHGDFFITPDRHTNGGDGCPSCSNMVRAASKTKTKEVFLVRAYDKHGDAYDYSIIDYKNVKTKIEIICKEHGSFWQSPEHHVYLGQGCPECAPNKISVMKRKPFELFVNEANNKHNSIYIYNVESYNKGENKIDILCNKHGIFQQHKKSHLSGAGCPTCSNNVSKSEIKWLDSLAIPHEFRQVILHIGNNKIKADAYDPNTNTIYEYWGDFWHGNPTVYNRNDINPRVKKTYGELFEGTQEKRRLIQNAGYNLIEIWGSDYKGSK